MARIIGGIGVSHTPTIGYARDRDLRNDPPWRPIFQDFDVVRDWLVSRQADVLLLTPKEVEYFRHGGLLQYVLRQLAARHVA